LKVDCSGFFSEFKSLISVSSELEDLCLGRVKLWNSRSMFNSLVYERECLINISEVQMVLRKEIIQPKLHSGILLIFIICSEDHFFLHIVAHSL